jgi:hypothetical protein
VHCVSQDKKPSKFDLLHQFPPTKSSLFLLMRTQEATASCASEAANVTSLADLAAAFNRLALAVEGTSRCRVVCQCRHPFLDLAKNQSIVVKDQEQGGPNPGE